MKNTNRILVAGATGYLGSHILNELSQQGYPTRVVVRNAKKLNSGFKGEMVEAELNQPNLLDDACHQVDTVISCVGITRQKDGLSHMMVDYQANLNLLNAAKKQGVRKFIFISVLNGEKLRNLKICEAKERFVDELKNSGLEYCVIRPNGFFSDIAELHKIAKKGKVRLFGNGQWKSNPIHGKDLAKVVVTQIETENKELMVGGPEVLTQKDMADWAFISQSKPVRISYLPDWTRKLLLGVVRAVLPKSKVGQAEFFLTVMAMDMVAPAYGSYRIKDYFMELSHNQKHSKQIILHKPRNDQKSMVTLQSKDLPAAA